MPRVVVPHERQLCERDFLATQWVGNIVSHVQKRLLIESIYSTEKVLNSSSFAFKTHNCVDVLQMEKKGC